MLAVCVCPREGLRTVTALLLIVPRVKGTSYKDIHIHEKIPDPEKVFLLYVKYTVFEYVNTEYQKTKKIIIN